MGIDLEAIRKKVNQLSGNSSRRSVMWRPEAGEHRVRILPWPDNDGQPFLERWFYYNIGSNPGILTLHQFGEQDPIQEIINDLRNQGQKGDKEAYELAKRLYPKMRAYAPIIIRGQEAEGVKLWSFGKRVYESILRIMLDEDYGDITDPLEGRDIKVTLSKPPGNQWFQTDVMPTGKDSPLSTKKSEMKEWLDNMPDLDEIYTKKSYDEIKKIVTDWLEVESDGGSDGTDLVPSKPKAEEKPDKKSFDDIDSAFNQLNDLLDDED